MSVSIFFLMLGLSIGSFGNVLLLRLPRQESLSGRSHCTTCRTAIRWWDLVPVVSFIILRGRCRHCHQRISFIYPGLELVAGMIFVLAFMMTPTNIGQAVCTGIILEFLLLACIYDALHQAIPDLCTIIIALTAIVSVIMQSYPIAHALIGAGIPACWFGGQWLVSRGRFVGSGDIFLATALGLWLGTSRSIVMILSSYIVGAVVVLMLLALHMIRLRDQRVAFAPFIGIGTVIALLDTWLHTSLQNILTW